MLLVIVLVVLIILYVVPGSGRAQLKARGYHTPGDVVWAILLVVLILVVLRMLALI